MTPRLRPAILILLTIFACPLLPGPLLPAADDGGELSPQDKLVVETVLRLQSFQLESSAPAKAAVLRYLRARLGSKQSFDLIRRFKPVEIAPDLAAFGLEHANETEGVRAAELLFAMGQQKRLLDVAEADDSERAMTAIALIGRSGRGKTVESLLPLVTSGETSMDRRIAALTAMGRQIDGQTQILSMVKETALPDELKFAAANVLLASPNAEAVEEASKYLSLPETADSQPLPPVVELAKRRGDVATGAKVFREPGTCIECHKIHGEGKEVGPDLSEIGSKLSREAMFVAILDPSAAVSHNFETYVLLTDDGTAFTGLLISQTDAAITLRTNEGIDRTVDREAVELFEKKSQSMMPQDLQRLMTAEQLVDLVEYLMGLQKSAEGSTAT
ncbi:c-type cytochrome [Allorhodopirellula solitaria]|uniref:Cytochrome c n=1 Tax=Allorhodopirellula solitaria TaxID=2527987 RepID=A0A5C5X0R8_9BACT|nr:c-type cytochrome [Allorhodopirellula solitaria]TWT56199.1 Cytochrome c [Allorhodopirellula solitaria]